MVGIYLSGTGNTKYCIEKLVSLIHSSAKAIPMESPEAISAIQQNEEIYIGYPTQFSNAPYMVRDFIKKNADIWKNKKILCIATMGAFSGDGAGCTTRMLKRYGATILGGIHIHMPDSVCDSKLLKKTMDENRCIIAQADRKIEEVALQIINGDYPQEGITLMEDSRHACGLVLDNGMELLLHIGIDTVEMQGDGFEYLIKEGQEVKAGTPLIRFNRQKIKEAGYSDVTVCVITDGADEKTVHFHTGIYAQENETVIIEIE